MQAHIKSARLAKPLHVAFNKEYFNTLLDSCEMATTGKDSFTFFGQDSLGYEWQVSMEKTLNHPSLFS